MHSPFVKKECLEDIHLGRETMKSILPFSITTFMSPLRSHAKQNYQFLGSTLSSLSKGIEEGNGLEITVYVLGCSRQIKMVVGEEDKVGDVILDALKRYAGEGQLPIMGLCADEFDLHCANPGSKPLGYRQDIKSCGSRSFLLCKKPTSLAMKRKGLNVGKLWRLKPTTALNLISLLSPNNRRNKKLNMFT